MANFKGFRLTKGQFFSEKWPNKIDCGGGLFRESYVRNGNFRNKYFLEKECNFCKKLTLVDRSNANRTKKSFCSIDCKFKEVKQRHKGNKHIKKRPTGDYHVLVLNHDHPRAGRSGQVYEHILVAEKKIGRSINKNERVHHINCIKNDNRSENLFVCENDKEHFLIHGSLNKCVAKLIDIGVLYFDVSKKVYKVRNGNEQN